MVKRALDLVLSTVGLLLFSPAFMVVAVLIKLDDGGPILFRGVRVGRYERRFRVLKFRSMVVNAEKIGGPTTADDDPRITRIGKVLRKYKLDELPQLINVWLGEMSFIGPRPEVPEEVATYSPEERKLLSVRPGITDYASIKFHNEGEILRGADDPHAAYRRLIRPEKVRLGLEYVRTASVKTDLAILLLTLRTLISARLRQDAAPHA